MLKQLTARGTDAPWYQGWDLSDKERASFRATTMASQAAKRRALAGECAAPKHPINVPRLDPVALMPQCTSNGLKALSLFSGGGGMDIGFDRAGFAHVANYEIMEGAAAVLRTAHPNWNVFGGKDGDVRCVDWASYTLLRFPEVPQLDIELIDRRMEPPLGAGEAASSPVPAALANAVFDATGVRLRTVPFTPARVKAALG